MNTRISVITAGAMALALMGAGCSSQVSVDTQAPQPAQPPSPRVQAMTFNPEGLAPNTLTVQAGDIVEFRNSDLKEHWPASAPHPSHVLYPELDSKAGVKAGDVWRFTATKKGTWKFHDHLNAGNVKFQGTLIVQ